MLMSCRAASRVPNVRIARLELLDGSFKRGATACLAERTERTAAERRFPRAGNGAGNLRAMA